MARHLAIVERSVSAGASAAYLDAIAARQASAAAANSHFWVFVHAADSNRFVEFTEGGDASLVAELAGVSRDSLWISVGGQ